MPSILDNGLRSPRKLLRKVVARLLGGKQRTSGIDGDVNERVAVVAKPLPGSRERARCVPRLDHPDDVPYRASGLHLGAPVAKVAACLPPVPVPK